MKAPLGAVRGVFHRAVPEAAVGHALEDGPSYTFQNRYNVAGRFGALYFGDRVEVCRATLEKRGLLPTRRLRFVLLSFEIRVDRVLDLGDPATSDMLDIDRDDLVAPRGTASAYRITQTIAAAAYDSGRIRGLLAPDATLAGNSLALYPARLLTKDFVRHKDSKVLW